MKKFKKLLSVVCLSLAIALACNFIVGATSSNNNENGIESEEDIYTTIIEQFQKEPQYAGAYSKKKYILYLYYRY